MGVAHEERRTSPFVLVGIVLSCTVVLHSAVGVVVGKKTDEAVNDRRVGVAYKD